MKQLRNFIILSVVVLFFASCSTQKAPVGGWHKKDHWYAPSNWHFRNKPTGF